MAFELFSGLSQNFSQLLDDADDYNIIIKVGENSNVKTFNAHSNILRARSPYFKRALSKCWNMKKNDIIEFIKPNISPIIFEMIIRYMYTGILDLGKQTGLNILDLLVASDELLIEELVTVAQKYLIENQTIWLEEKFPKVLQTVFQLESCKQLQNYCLESICDYPEPFFNSSEFPEKSILLGLIKRDDLQVDEIELWNYLIKWGIFQTSELIGKNTTNLNCWNKKDFLALKNILNPFIFYIRFFEISSKDFHSKIWPFKNVLPEKLFEDIVSFHLAGTQPKKNMLPRHGKISIDSIIIKPKHAPILANWTQRKGTNERIQKDEYNFNLIYRGSRDGLDINTMRSKCNGQGACISIIKIKENGTIIGGYNPIGWTYQNNYNHGSFYWSNNAECFIFSLHDGKDLSKAKISRVTNRNYAIYEAHYTNNLALNFGNSDLIINGTNGSCRQCYYESSIIDTNNFSIEEMEIFKFIKSK